MDDLRQSVIRILNARGQTLGAGFVISEHLAVTCAHVIGDVGAGHDQPVQIQFFFDEDKLTADQSKEYQQTAFVLGAGWSSRDADDVAFLQLEHLPPDVVPVVLGSVEKCGEHSYASFGFAKLVGYDMRWAHGTLDGVVFIPDKRKRSMLQLKGDEIKGGMSGAPVLDTQTDRVVGMISEYKDGDHSRFVWATTSDTLLNLAAPLLQDHPTLRLWPEAYGPIEQEMYLQHLIATNEILLLPDGRDILLERIYVSLRADEMNAAERQAEHKLYLKDVAMFKKLANGAGEDQYAEFDAIRKAIIRQPTMFLLQARNWPRLFGERERRSLSLAEVEKRNRYVVVLGDPGSGKTTLGKWLVLQFARALLQGKTFVQVRADLVQPGAKADKPIDLGPARLPIFIRIADYARVRWEKDRGDTKLSLEKFISLYWNSNDLPFKLSPDAVNAMVNDYLLQGRALVVLDGLDEVSDPSQRRLVMQTVKKFVQSQSSNLPKNNEWAGNRLLLTSRIVGYQFDPLTDLPHYTVEDMDETAIGSFCRAWMTHVAGTKEAEEQGKKLKDAIFDHSHPGVRTLAGNPLLLTILAQVYWSSASHSLPTRRVSLFDSAVQALYDQRKDFWERANISLIRLTQAMGAVAAHIHANERTGFAEGGTVRAQLLKIFSDRDQVETVLQAARQVSGFLVERGEGVYGFLHRAVQEYFAAKHLADRPAQVSARLAERLLEPTWREPIILAVGVVSQPDYPDSLEYLAEAFETLLNTPDPAGDFLPRRELLAVAACLECERVPPETGRRIAERLLVLYAHREGGRRSPVLRKRIHDAFLILGQNETRLQAEAALCVALSSADFELRYAATDTIIETKWDSIAIAHALVDAWSQYADPAVSLLTALDEMLKRSPACFQTDFLPLRQAVTGNPLLWETASISLQWKAVFRVLYLPLGAYFKPDRINRDSPLTSLLLEMLQRPKPLDPSVFEEFRKRLLPLTYQTGSALARDAALALSALGDGTWIQRSIDDADTQGYQMRPIVACLSLALSLELSLDYDRVLSNDLDLALKQAMMLARAFTRLCRDVSTSAQSLQEVKTRIQAVEPLASEGIAYISAYVNDLINQPVLVDTYARELALALKDDLEHAREYTRGYASASSVAFNPDFIAKIKRMGKLCQEIDITHRLTQKIADNRRAANMSTRRNERSALMEQIRKQEIELSRKSSTINTLATDLGLCLPLDIAWVHERATRLVNRQQVQQGAKNNRKPVPIQEIKNIQTLAQELAPINELKPVALDTLEPVELREIAEALSTILGPVFPLDAQGLHNMIGCFNRMLKHALTDLKRVNIILSIDLFNPAQITLVGLLQRNLMSLSDLLSNYIDVLKRARGKVEGPLITKAQAYAKKIVSLIPQVYSLSRALGIGLPIDWQRAQSLVTKYLDEYEQDFQVIELGHNLIAVLNDITNLRQQRIRELAFSRSSASDPILGIQAHERARVYEDEIVSANERAHNYATALNLVTLDISSALEYARRQERNQSSIHSQALSQVRFFEIEFARIVARIQDQFDNLELAVSQELVTRRPTGKLSPNRSFAPVQELIELRARAREDTDKTNHLRGLIHEKAEEFSQVLTITEKQAYKLLQQFELAFRSNTELSSEIDLVSARRLDLLPDLDVAFELARPTANVNELVRYIDECQRIVENDGDVKQHLEKACVSAQNVQKVLTTSTPIAQIMSMLIDMYIQRWPMEASSAIVVPERALLNFESITHLVDDLNSSNDSRREQAKALLGAKRRASELGQAVVEKIAEFIDRYAQDPQIVTQLLWALENVIHDRPSWMTEWIEQTTLSRKEAQTILDAVHRVTAKTCDTILDTLPSAEPHVNISLLNSLSWLVRLKQVPRGRLPMLRERLFVWLADEEDPAIRCSIILILGYWQEGSDGVGLALLDQFNHLTMKSDLPALYKALARLAVQRPNIEEKVKQKFRGAYSDVDAAGGLIRLYVTKNKEIAVSTKQRELEGILNVLSRASLDKSHGLNALLKAGVDDDIWDDEYHGVLVNATRAQLELQINQAPDESLLADLLIQFEDALKSRDWPLRRFILAVVAACTEVMPVAVQHAYNGNLEDLLVKATTDAESFNSRRFALTALSYLRTVTPAIIPALLAGCHDTEDVQHDTITAASRFQSIEGNLLSGLMEKISGESVSRAYTVAHLLSALGGSVASEASDLRNQIIEAVVEALKDEGSQREVLISGEHKGKLEDALYTTLLRVAGWMG